MYPNSASVNQDVPGRKEENVLFNDTLNTFYLQLYGIGKKIFSYVYISIIINISNALLHEILFLKIKQKY